jgi:hypothetical protein
VLEGCFDVVIDTDSSQKTVRAALIDADSGLGQQVVATRRQCPGYRRSTGRSAAGD